MGVKINEYTYINTYDNCHLLGGASEVQMKPTSVERTRAYTALTGSFFRVFSLL